MTGIIQAEYDPYERYEELLIQKEQYEREAEQIRMAFTKEFGALYADIFKAKLECIRLKRMISHCQTALNRGEPFDQAAVITLLNKRLAAMQKQLDDMLYRNQEAKKETNETNVPSDQLEQVKKVYRRLAKKLHPDINPKTAEIDELKELWNRIGAAYKAADPNELTQLEVLVNLAMTRCGLQNVKPEIPDLEERIRQLEDEINVIITTEPYIYKEILEDPEKRAALHETLQNELNELLDYRRTLEQTLQTLRKKGGEAS